ncbi:MAG: diacylglycerol kinase, partial [Phototrophicales bacterium]
MARSIDGFIADRIGGLDWLQSVPNPENIDMGYNDFIQTIDALVMGRKTYETVCGFGIDWPYQVPVFVLSNTLKEVRSDLKEKVEIVNEQPTELVTKLNRRGYNRLYIDGGSTIRSFLREDLIDELILTTLPVLLGGGSPLFQELPFELNFEHVQTKVFLNEVV